MDCTRLWFDNSAPGSVRSVTVNGVTLRFTGGTSLTTYTTGGALITGSATNSLNGTSTKVFFEGARLFFARWTRWPPRARPSPLPRAALRRPPAPAAWPVRFVCWPARLN